MNGDAIRSHGQKRISARRRAPYVLSNTSSPSLRVNSVSFHAVGGADLDLREPAFRAEVFNKIRNADHVSVRDLKTQQHLRAAGIDAPLVPDPAIMVAELFGTQIRERAAQGEVRQMLDAFPEGYAALQFNATFGDDATLDTLARQLQRTAKADDLGIVLFRAGAAPWHDDLDVYRRLAARLSGTPVRLFNSLYLWDIVALIAQSRIYCGSSLHGRIVAMAFARPRINLVHAVDVQPTRKQAAFAMTWEPPGIVATTGIADMAEVIGTALRTDPELMRDTAASLARQYRDTFGASQDQE
jgi:hypothetical protein